MSNAHNFLFWLLVPATDIVFVCRTFSKNNYDNQIVHELWIQI